LIILLLASNWFNRWWRLSTRELQA